MQWMQYWEDFSIDERKICASGNFSQQTMSIVTEWDSVQINSAIEDEETTFNIIFMTLS